MTPENAIVETENKPELKLGKFDFDLSITSEKKVRVQTSYDGEGVDGGAFVEVEPEVFAEKLKKAIPGEVDDLVIDGLIKLLKR